MPATDPAINGWHLDKRVPLALIVTIFIQTAGAFWWAATIAARVNYLEETQISTSGRGDRITRLEANQGHISRMLQRIEAKLDNIGGK